MRKTPGNYEPGKDTPVSPCDVCEIESMLRTGDISQAGIARLFNITQEYVSNINAGLTGGDV